MWTRVRFRNGLLRSAPFRPWLPMRCLRFAWGYPALDPRPRASLSTHDFTREPPITRFSESGCCPIDFCNVFPTHGHTPEHPIPAFIPKTACGGKLRVCPCVRRSSYGAATFPSRRRIAKAASRDSPFEVCIHDAARAAWIYKPRKPSSGQDVACGRRPEPDLRLRRKPLDDSAGLHGPSRPSSEGPPFRLLLPQKAW